MKDTIKCCISCILPCGVLDVIRIVHANGRVEEISHAISAGEVMQAYPKHVLRRPPSSGEEEGGGAAETAASQAPKAGILPPNAELQRGKIYFLMPVAAAPEKAKRRRKKRVDAEGGGGTACDRARLLVSSDQYLSEIMMERSMTSDRRRGRVAVWRPHLESISEVSNDL